MFANNLTTKKKAVRKGSLTILIGLLALLVVFLLALSQARPAQAATTVINICSHNGTAYYNILGGNAQPVRDKLNNTANFGPSGTYGDFDFEYINVGDNFTEQTILNNGCNIWYSGYEHDATYTAAELTELQNWVTNHNGQAIAGCDHSSYDPVCNLLDFTVTNDSDSYGFVVEQIVNPITCDDVLGPGDQLNMAGGAGAYFTGTAVTADNVLAVHETGGAPDNNKPIVVYTGNLFLTTDINMIGSGDSELTVSPGPNVITNNDIMVVNAFSALADVSIGNDICSSAGGGSENVAPSVEANADSVTVNEGDTANNSGTFSDTEGTPVTISASIGTISQDSGSSGTWSWSFATTDGPDNDQTVTITATDGDGESSSTSFELVVNNVAPSVGADTDPVIVNEGDTANNSGTFSDPGDDVVTITSSVGTISQDNGNSGTWTWSYPTTDGPDDSQTVLITATDSDGESSSTPFELVVNNVAPTVDAGEDQTVLEDVEVDLDPATFTDPGVLDTHTAEIDWEDGNVEAGVVDQGANTVSGSHVYADPGTYIVTVTVEDDDGDSHNDQVTINVLNRFMNYCIYANDDVVQIEENVDVDCNVAGEDLIEIKKDADLVLDIFGRQDVKLEENSSVRDVYAGGSIEIKENVDYDSATEGADIPEVTQVSYRLYSNRKNITVNKGQTKVLAPGRYGKLLVKENATLELTAGKYEFKEFKVDKKGTVAFTGGDTVVTVRRDVDIQEEAKLTGTAEEILFKITGTAVKLGKDSEIRGTFLAPRGHVDVLEGAWFRGLIYGEKVQVKKDADIFGAPAVGPFISYVLE